MTTTKSDKYASMKKWHGDDPLAWPAGRCTLTGCRCPASTRSACSPDWTARELKAWEPPARKGTGSRRETAFDLRDHYEPGAVRKLSEEYGCSIETMADVLTKWHTAEAIRDEFGGEIGRFLALEFSSTSIQRAFRR